MAYLTFFTESEPVEGELSTVYTGSACQNAVVGTHYRAVSDAQDRKLIDFGITFIEDTIDAETSVVEQEYKIVYKTVYAGVNTSYQTGQHNRIQYGEVWKSWLHD